ncbi:MAG TPA: hypothetical protein VGK47_06260 [Nitrososphaeraceae archaeon]
MVPGKMPMVEKLKLTYLGSRAHECALLIYSLNKSTGCRCVLNVILSRRCDKLKASRVQYVYLDNLSNFLEEEDPGNVLARAFVVSATLLLGLFHIALELGGSNQNPHGQPLLSKS